MCEKPGKMINKTNGSILINETLITPKYTIYDFKSSPLYSSLRKEQINLYQSYYLQPIESDGKTFSISLHFDSDHIIRIINISILLERPSLLEEWSDEFQKETKKANDRWLREEIGGSPYNYHWGTISSEYDPRSGSSLITINFYKRE